MPADYDSGTGDPNFDSTGPGPGGRGVSANYLGTGNVVDTAPRTISNLLVDQTAFNLAAVRAALSYLGIEGTDVPDRERQHDRLG